MKLQEIIEDLEVKAIIGDIDINISGVKINSKELKKGDLYICINGNNFDGHDYALEAKRYGAVALLCEKQVEVDLPQIIVKNARLAMSKVASTFYKNPSKKMKIIGVTGTNGKTTVSWLIKKILESSGRKVGLIGTLGVFFGNTFLEPTLTTPDPLYLHKILAEMYGYGIDYVVMEVSAHAAQLNKIDDINFEVGVFTNFTQDHLDFFNDMQTYKNAKLKFINHQKCKYIVTNVDDEVGKTLIDEKNTYSYGCYNPSDIFAINIKQSVNGMSFVLNIFDDIFTVNTKLIGLFNVYNIMSAISASLLVGVKKSVAINAICQADCVNGRLEKVENKKGIAVYVDYAHTPDGLKRSLQAVKCVTDGKLICVFGCGGNRDVTKRSIMGEISGENADFTIITSDNPRYEEPMSIIQDIENGVLKKTQEFIIIEKREDAIAYALNSAKVGDTVLIAGKGAEKYQDILGIKHPYNDKETIINYFANM